MLACLGLESRTKDLGVTVSTDTLARIRGNQEWGAFGWLSRFPSIVLNYSGALMRTCSAVFVLLLLFVPRAEAGAGSVCSGPESQKIERSVSQMKSWSEVSSSFHRNPSCSRDNAVEVWTAYSEVIAGLLARHWDKIDDLVRLTSFDAKFRQFVIEHVGDQTLPAQVLGEIRSNAENKCPFDAKKLCGEIAAATR